MFITKATLQAQKRLLFAIWERDNPWIMKEHKTSASRDHRI